ncbi:MAG: cytochrome c3 family protein [Deltaproteobacteria bacterium]
MRVEIERKKKSGPNRGLAAKWVFAGFFFSLLCCWHLSVAPGVQAKTTAEKCTSCHQFELDADHRMACTRCHAGNPTAGNAEEAHRGMVARPAHPDQMEKACGTCHQQVHSVRATIHFTLNKEINMVRRALGANKPLAGPDALVRQTTDKGLLALGDDMLRRRCLRCHVYYPGDDYPATRGGTGCAACHLKYKEGRLVSHQFIRTPPDELCLRCHYSNFVGADYYGRFEHDFNAEYRTPFDPEGVSHRPYGVEYHQLTPDTHQRAGMACIDCHTGAELMGEESGPAAKGSVACTDCHSLHGKPVPLVTRLTGKKLVAPAMQDKAHDRYVGKVDCAVCHAQWTFSDEGTHLIRLDVMDFDPWVDLTVQSSYEVEEQLEDALYGGGSYDMPFMRDKFTGENKLGLWLKGFGQRRWEKVAVCTDGSGKLRVCRPLLDLYFSYVDEAGKVIFDSQPIAKKEMKLLPYEPHTIGRAGLFYRRRLPGGEAEAKRPTAEK